MEKYQLSNGLRIVLEKIPTCRSAAFGIWVKTGSRSEHAGNNGISHFIEHMLFKGTDRFTAKDIAETFDGLGGNVNAFTSKEYTCYYAKVLDIHLPIALDVLSDMFFHSRLDQTELDKERNVIVEEISMYEDTPDDLVHDLIAQAAYQDHPLGYTILGTEQNLNSMDAAQLQDYMARNYHIGNLVISIAGNIDEGILPLIERHFGGYSNTRAPQTLTAPGFHGERMFQAKKTEQNHICMALPGIAVNDANLYAMVLLNNAIGGGMSSRLFQEIREKRGLAYSVYSYHTSQIDSGMLTIYAGTAPKQTQEVLDVTMDILRSFKDTGMTGTELQKGKEQLKGSLILSLESTTSRMNRLGKNELLTGRHYTLDEMIEQIDAVTAEDVKKLAEQVFSGPVAAAMVGRSDQALSRLPLKV